MSSDIQIRKIILETNYERSLGDLSQLVQASARR
jgi:hypothetical protein